MVIKLCVFCAHMEWEHEKATGGGCETCGFGADEGKDEMVCTKGHWRESAHYSEFLKDYRKKIRIAETCKDYEVAADV